jgi:hypothetical protein
MMIDDDPVRPVEPGLEAEVRHPGGTLPQVALPPRLVMVGFDRIFSLKKCFARRWSNRPEMKAVEVALVGENHFGFGQRCCHLPNITTAGQKLQASRMHERQQIAFDLERGTPP